MKYWAYMNNKVCGPFEKEKLAGLENFGPASLLCPDTPGGAQASAWKAASSYPEVAAALASGPAAEKAPRPVQAQPVRPAAIDPVGLTMRGSLIDEPILNEPAAGTPAAGAAAPARRPADDSPLLMTMRGSLISEPIIEEPAAAPQRAAAAVPEKASAPEAKPLPKAAPGAAVPVLPEGLGQKLDQIGAELSSVAESQSQLLVRLNGLETAIKDLKALLVPAPSKKI